MKQTGEHNSAYGADKFGFKDLAEVHWNLDAPVPMNDYIIFAEAIAS